MRLKISPAPLIQIQKIQNQNAGMLISLQL